MGDIAVGDTYPDMTFVFHLDPEIAAQRVGDDTDRIESRSDDFLEKVDAGFRAEAELASIQMELIDANRSVESIQKQIRELAESVF